MTLRTVVRWLVSAGCGFLIAVIIVNMTLPVLVDVETPQWFMKTFPIFGGPVLWIGFALLANFLIKKSLRKSRSGESAT